MSLNLPRDPYLRSPVNAADGAERAALIERAIQNSAEIRQIFAGVAEWNETHPDEAPVGPDPTGELAECLAYYDALIAQAVN